MFFCEYIYMKTFFHCFISRKYAFDVDNIDVLQHRCSWNFLKIYWKTPATDSLDCGTDVFLKISLKVFGTSFIQNIFERLLLISIQSSYCFKAPCFRTDQYLFKITIYFRVYENSSPPSPLGLRTFLPRIKYYWGKNYTCIKKLMIFIS